MPALCRELPADGRLSAAFAVAGIGLLSLLLVDVFLTVFHAQGHGGPVTRVQNRAVWAMFRAAGVRSEREPRQGLLSLAAPLMIVSTLALWVLLLVVGFALVYYPWVETFLVSPGVLRGHWVKALYYSGYTAATLGLGDLVPNDPALRLLTTVEAFSGFALLSAAVTYMLAVYRELLAMQSLATSIAGYFRAGQVHTREFASAGGYAAMARWSEGTATQLLHVLQAHFQYPILHYFRPAKNDRALPVQLGHLVDLRRVSQRDDLAGAAMLLAQHPSFLALHDAVAEYLRTVEEVFIPRERTQSSSPEADPVLIPHHRLLLYMGYLGNPGIAR